MTSYQVLDYNRPDLTRNAIESIRRWAPEPYEIIVLENGSMGTAEELSKEPRVRVLNEGRNLGYQAGHNLMALRASPEATEFVVLDNDMFFSEGSPRILVDTVRANPGDNFVSVVQISAFDIPLYDSRTPRLEDIQDFTRRYPGAYRGDLKPIPTLPFCISRNAWEKLSVFDVWEGKCLEENKYRGAFDEGIDPTGRGWHSDWDLYNRAILMGMRVCVPGAMAYHYHHATLSAYDSQEPSWVTHSERRYDLKYGSRTAKISRDSWKPRVKPGDY